ncbi:MAG: HPr(Ser) kinase/phosphatase [Clostridia bacterium]|nr:HPr(Ser) kinase/phosphatase [Clostridia bacterium]MBQ9785821.1 HPr(Ser) kinase/phosphatase [Clostridia bacterium]
MKRIYKVALTKIVEDFRLEVIVRPENFESIQISSPEVNRPGLALAGFYEIFEPERIQLIGKAETQYLQSLDPEKRCTMLQRFVDAHPVAIIYTTDLPVDEALIERATAVGVPVLRTNAKTSQIMASLISSLSVYLAPRITRHGGLVEVYGEGMLLLGDSGVGKSETTIELIKRGHRLIADDAVEIKRVSDKTLVGSAPDLIRHYVELRGIGIVDVRRLFGMGAVKETEKIDLVIQLENWVEGKMYDRLGMDEEKINILGIDVPCITVPVRPGRNLAIILEVAAMNYRQKRMGYNTAEEFNKRMMRQMGVDEL